MEDSSPHSFGLGVYHNHKVTLVNDTIPRAKRPLDLLEEDEPLQSDAKKRRHLSNYCSTPCPSKKLPLCSPDSACFLGSSGCLDDTELENIVIRVSLPEDSVVALSVNTARCFDDSEPDDSLLDPSDDEQGNSPFNYTEEECREMLADDYLGDDQNTTGESALVNQDVWGQSEKEVSSNCSLASVPPEDTETSFRTIDELVSNESLSQTGSSVNPGCFQILEAETANPEGEGCLNVDCLKSNQVTCTLFDCDLQGPLNLSPTDADSVDQSKGVDGLEETGEKASHVIDDHLQNASKQSIEYDEISSNSLVVEESLECLASKEHHSGDLDSVEKLPSEIKESSPFCDAHIKTSTYSPEPACGQSKDKVENPAPGLLLHLKTSNVILNQDPSEGTDNGLSGTFGSQKEDLSQESTSVEELSDNPKLNSVALDRNCGEDSTCGKKLGKVIPVPQVEERPKQRICISEAELEQKKRIYIQCVRAHVKNSMDPTPDALNELYALMNKVASREYRTQDRRWQHPSDLTMRKYPRFSKKPTQKCSLKQWVSRNLAHHRRFQDIPDHFQRSSVTASSNV
ncbi:S100P-binding protein isoform X1 [Mauremys reevesii]|uniref:S100P-binding protein isoform X1 n=1 Tax=Mauremys reevesii TaxID=260615 RepID=UPI00193FDCDA|nr:S100P-binding protein isoform X1 [Mauremys reevesii]XP_039367420.1 S100P-binding protein isoform X1 [Mauremys reevesii]XP_039367421.1 S100P-binding protein isoform X1 [Mauremys reevesii]